MAGKKTNYIKTGALAAKKQRKRDEAIARQQKRDGRSASEQIALLRKRPGNATREKAKLGLR